MKPQILRNFFLVLFVASTLAFVLFSRAGGDAPPATEPTQVPGIVTPEVITTAEPGDTSENPTTVPSGNVNSSAVLGSIITSVTSLVGFITTTVITWRKEKRESSLADMERRKLETELEKSKLELEELKKRRERKEVRKKK
jgi:hypothetical protein